MITSHPLLQPIDEEAMSVSIDIPDQLAELLRIFAAQRGMSLEEFSQQALTVGLTTLAQGLANEGDVDVSQLELRPSSNVLMPSPIIVRGPVRPLQVTFEPMIAPSTDAH
jgi:plasmid stability protein